MQPITFEPLYMERVWGGRKLESVYNRNLPTENPFGESWELTDRENEQSVVTSENFKGQTLNQLWTEKRSEIFGADMPECDRFPLLIKILDARSNLSIQVHPPQAIAADLGGDPKTEMWYIADADKDAQLYVGLKNGASRESFEKSLHDGTVDQQVHAITPKIGESIHLESGRLHAIGAGFLIYEIQQNSDTTYRVFDWNRVGLDGVARELHIDQSMASIDFDDFEPDMDTPDGSAIASCDFYVVDQFELNSGDPLNIPNPSRFAILTVVSGELTGTDGASYTAGKFMLLPANSDTLTASSDAKVLVSTLPVA